MKRLVILLVVLIALLFGVQYIGVRINSQQSNQSKKTSSTDNTQSSTSCTGKQTVEVTEGPYHSQGSPERTVLYEQGMPGTKLTLTGYVLNTNCKPVTHAWLDFWQANAKGEYDNAGYTLRGHQYTDAQGKYTLITIVPGEYPGRTPHIHVKVRANNSSKTITTQLFIPGIADNAKDSIFDKSLLMNISDRNGKKFATYNFVVPD